MQFFKALLPNSITSYDSHSALSQQIEKTQLPLERNIRSRKEAPSPQAVRALIWELEGSNRWASRMQGLCGLWKTSSHLVVLRGELLKLFALCTTASLIDDLKRLRYECYV